MVWSGYERTEPMNKVVARFADGHTLKGMTADFSPAKDIFHVSPADAPDTADPLEVRATELKALFFVKSLEGDRGYDETREFDPMKPAVARRIKVVFKDGEVLVGTTTGYRPNRPGFFLEPADDRSNNERCYVVSADTREVRFV